MHREFILPKVLIKESFLNHIVNLVDGMKELRPADQLHYLMFHVTNTVSIPGLCRSMFTLLVSSSLQVVALNKRSKEAESAFLGIYKQLIEAPGESPTKTRAVHLHKHHHHHTLSN